MCADRAKAAAAAILPGHCCNLGSATTQVAVHQHGHLVRRLIEILFVFPGYFFMTDQLFEFLKSLSFQSS